MIIFGCLHKFCYFPSYNVYMKYWRIALGFLTVIPVATVEDVDRDDLGRSAGWYPLVGVFIGAVVALVKWIAGFFISPFAAAVLAAGCWILLTGGLHLDGLADCCDGMLVAATPERRLEIMKDSRLGTFGVTGLVLHLLLKIAFLSVLSGINLALAVPLAASLGRWMVLLAARQPLAKSEGLGAAFATHLKAGTYFAALILPLGLACAAGVRGGAAFLFVHLTGWAVFRFSKHRIGGLTGDVYGMLIELSEIIVLLVFSAQSVFEI